MLRDRMKLLPPYEIPEQDADLWECGRRLTGGDEAPHRTSLMIAAARLLAVLNAADDSGVRLRSKSECARLARMTVGRAREAMRYLGETRGVTWWNYRL